MAWKIENKLAKFVVCNRAFARCAENFMEFIVCSVVHSLVYLHLIRIYVEYDFCEMRICCEFAGILTKPQKSLIVRMDWSNVIGSGVD